MRCKHCQAELDENTNICPACGMVNKEKGKDKSLLVMKILAFSLLGVVLLTALAGAISYGLTGRILPTWLRKNDIYCKQSYTVSLKKLNSSLGNKKFQNSRETVVATMGEDTLTNRMLQVYFWDVASSSEYADLDKDTPLDQQYQDPVTQKTWQQFFIEQSIDAWKRDMLVKNMALEAGFEMPEEYVEQFDSLEADMIETAKANNYTTLEALLESMSGRGTTYQTYYDYLWNYFIGGNYWADVIEETEVDMEDIEAYYEANKDALVIDDGYFTVTKDSGKLVDVRHILIKPEGDILDEDGEVIGISDESWAACEAKAQAILDEWLAGEKTEDSFADLATANTQDSGSKSTGGLYTEVYKGMMVQAFNDWCFDESRQAGDYGMVKTGYGYHIMYYVDGEEGWIKLCTEGAKTKKSSQFIDELANNTTVEVDYKKIVLAELD